MYLSAHCLLRSLLGSCLLLLLLIEQRRAAAAAAAAATPPAAIGGARLAGCNHAPAGLVSMQRRIMMRPRAFSKRLALLVLLLHKHFGVPLAAVVLLLWRRRKRAGSWPCVC